VAEDLSSVSPFLAGRSKEAHVQKDVSELPIKVLLIEDNPADVFVITEVLNQCNFVFECQVATDGEMALAVLQRYEADGQCPSLILLDLNLPKRSGTEILHYIRKSCPCRQAPVVIISSSDAPVDIGTVMAVGATSYFRKPTNLQQYMNLRNVIQKVLISSTQA
jgi:CheY-like chemotaxis protein